MASKEELWYVALVDLSDPSAAATIHSRADTRELSRLGWNVTLFGAASRNYTPPANLHEVAVTTGKGLKWRVLFELLMVWRVLRAKRDIYFVFFRGPSTMLILTWLLVLLGIPFGVELNGVLNYHLGSNSVRDRLFGLSDRFSMNHAAIIVAVTPQLGKLASDYKGEGTHVVLAPNGVDVDVYAPTVIRPPLAADQLHLGWIGAFYELRGLPLSIEVVAALNDRGCRTHLTLVGDGPLYHTVADLVTDMGLQEHVTFTGRVPPHLVVEHVAQCDLMIAFFEPSPRISLTGLSPLKVATYLALAKPLLLWDCGLVGQVDQVPGVFRVPDVPTPDQLADQIQDIWQRHSHEGLKQLGVRGREFAKHHMTWAMHAQIIDQAIRQTLSGRNRV